MEWRDEGGCWKKEWLEGPTAFQAALKFFRERNCFPILDSHWSLARFAAVHLKWSERVKARRTRKSDGTKMPGKKTNESVVVVSNSFSIFCFVFFFFVPVSNETKITRDCVARCNYWREQHIPWPRNYSGHVRVQLAGQFSSSNSEGDCLSTVDAFRCCWHPAIFVKCLMCFELQKGNNFCRFLEWCFAYCALKLWKGLNFSLKSF